VKKLIFFLIPLIFTAFGWYAVSDRSYFKPNEVNTVPLSNPVDHSIWDELLNKHVDEDGWVDYKGFIKDRIRLSQYLDLLSENRPNEATWTTHQQLAYWINAYNAFTIKLIIDNYPLESIKDIQFNIPGLHTVWHKEFFNIGGKPSSLDEIEHKILRKKFDEPRIHFAIVCASISCPPLRNEAFVSSRLNEQLEDQGRIFINDPSRNMINAERVKISKIFSWFKGDFTKEGSLIEFLNQFSKTSINRKAKVSYLDYDWGLNEQKGS
jgi:hypothetical protein